MPTLDLLSREERNLYNPAFTGLLVTRAVQGYEREYGPGCHVVLAVLAPVMSLVPQVRTVLPATTAATAVNWIERESAARIHLAQAAPVLGPIVRNGLMLGLQASVLAMADGQIVRSTGRIPTRMSGASTAEVPEIQKASYFLGRWLPRAGDVATVLTLLGVRP
jgi:hypothetical protein